MDNSTPPQASNTEVTPPAPEQPALQSPPADQPKKPNSKKKRILIIALVVLVLGGAAAAFYLMRNQSAMQEVTDNETVNQPTEQAKVESTKMWVMSYSDEKDRFVEISYDGSEVTSKKQSYTPSFSSNYIASVTKKGVEVAPSDNPDESVVVLEKKSGEDVDFVWYDDADRLIVSTQRIPNKPANPGQYYIPDVRQSFYAVNPDGSDKRKLFDKQTTYGSAFITGVSSERKEYYWSVVTEGGPESLLNISSLETGKILKKLTPKAYGSEEIIIVDDHAYYVSTASTIRKINLDTYKDTLVTSPLGSKAGFSNEALTSTCSVGGSIESILRDNGNDKSLLFSTVTNKPHQTVIYSMNLETEKSEEVTSFDSVRQIKLLASDKQKIVYARSRTNTCNAKNEDVETSNVYVYDRASKKNVTVDIDVDEQFFGGDVYFFAKPVN